MIHEHLVSIVMPEEKDGKNYQKKRRIASIFF